MSQSVMAVDSNAQSKTASSFGKQGFGVEDQCKLQQVLTKKLGPSLISQRPSSTEGQRVAFVETWKLISLANELFGFNGWSNSITSQTIDYVDEIEGRYHVGVSACVRVTLKDGVYHEELGYGVSEGLLSKGSSIEKARKEAVSDGLKRSLRHFGNALGNCLGDKLYLQWVVNAADTRSDCSTKSCDSLSSGLVTSSQMTAPAPPPVSSAPSLVLDTQQQPQQQQQQQQPQQQQVLQVQLPHQTTTLQAHRLPGPFQQQLPILQPIALATGTGGLNKSSAQQLFFVRPMSQAGLSSGVATLAAIPSSGLQTLTALPSSSLHTLTQLSQPPQLAQATQMPAHLSQTAQLSHQSHLAQALQHSTSQPIVHCSQQQAQHFAPLQQSVQSILTPHQPKTSITQAVNQIKTLFNKNKQPTFSTCPALFNSSSISGNLPCISASSCTTSASVSTCLNGLQAQAHCGVASSLSTPVVTAVSSAAVQNGVTQSAKSLNVLSPLPHISQSVTNNNTQSLNSNIKIIQNRYQGKPRSSVPSSTYGHIRDIQPRISSQVSQQREKVNSNSSDSSESQSRPRLRVICPPLESESQHQPEEPNLALSKKKRARSRSSQRANNDSGEKAPAKNQDSLRAVKKACIPLVTIHCPLEANDHIDIKQENMDYEDTMQSLDYIDPLKKCEVVIESSYSLSSKEDEASLASEKDNDGDDEDEDDESVTVAKAMNTLFREGVKGQDSDFDQVSDHLLKEAGKTCSTLKFNAVVEDSDGISSVSSTATQQSDNQLQVFKSGIPESPKINEKWHNKISDSHPSSNENPVSAAESERSKDLNVKDEHDKRKTASQPSPEVSESDACTNPVGIADKTVTKHVLKNNTLASTETKKTSQPPSVNSLVSDLGRDVEDDMLEKNKAASVMLGHSKDCTNHDEEKSPSKDNYRVEGVLCQDTNTKNEIKAAYSNTKGRNEFNHSSNKGLMDTICAEDVTNPSKRLHENNANLLPANPLKEASSITEPTEDTIGASLAKAEKEFNERTEKSLKKREFKAGRDRSLKKNKIKSKRERSLKKKELKREKVRSLKLMTSLNPKAGESSEAVPVAREGNADVKSEEEIKVVSGIEADASLELKTPSLYPKPDKVSQEQMETSPLDNGDILDVVKIDSEPNSITGTASKPVIDSAMISNAEMASKMKTDTLSAVEITVSPSSPGANPTITRAIDASNAQAEVKPSIDNKAASNVELIAESVGASSCKSPRKEIIVSKNVIETADESYQSNKGKESKVLEDVNLAPSSCETKSIKGEDCDVKLNVPPLHTGADGTFEDLFETVNSPSSDNENSFMGFPEAVQSSAAARDGITQQLSATSPDKSKSSKQNWKFKFRVREGSANNTRPKKNCRPSSPLPGVRSSASPSSSKYFPQNSSSGKKAGGDTEPTRASHLPPSVRGMSPDTGSLSLHTEEALVVSSEGPAVRNCLSAAKDQQNCLISAKDQQNCHSGAKDQQNCLSTAKDQQNCLSSTKDQQNCLSSAKDQQNCLRTAEDQQNCLSSTKDQQNCLSIAKETGNTPSQNHETTSYTISVSSSSSAASGSARRAPVSPPDATGGASAGKSDSSVEASVTAIITEDAAVTSLSTLVTNGSLLHSPDDTDRPASPTIGRECRKDRASKAQCSLVSKVPNPSDVRGKKEAFNPSRRESESVKIVRKFESIINGDVR